MTRLAPRIALACTLAGLATLAAPPAWALRERVSPARAEAGITVSARTARPLAGHWRAEAVEGAAPGVLELRADGTVRLAPQGFDPVEGTWHADTRAGTLTVTISGAGTALMGYTLSGDTLTLRYASGVQQSFIRTSSSSSTRSDSGPSKRTPRP